MPRKRVPKCECCQCLRPQVKLPKMERNGALHMRILRRDRKKSLKLTPAIRLRIDENPAVEIETIFTLVRKFCK
jgi:hypothetical protein